MEDLWEDLLILGRLEEHEGSCRLPQRVQAPTASTREGGRGGVASLVIIGSSFSPSSFAVYSFMYSITLVTSSSIFRLGCYLSRMAMIHQ